VYHDDMHALVAKLLGSQLASSKSTTNTAEMQLKLLFAHTVEVCPRYALA